METIQRLLSMFAHLDPEVITDPVTGEVVALRLTLRISDAIKELDGQTDKSYDSADGF
jgi:hypothetical protein